MENCPPIELLQRLLDADLPVEAADEFEAHLQTCRSCEHRLDHLVCKSRDSLPPSGLVLSASEAQVPTDLRGTWPTVPGYEIVAKLGQGGSSIVYKARQLGLDRWVALKMLLGGAHATPAQRERFLAEARTVAALHHPNIVQIHEIGDHGGVPFFALELVEGGSLRSWLAGNPIPARAAAQLLERLALAMVAAHQQGIIHRDLKPDNVLLQDPRSQVQETVDFELPVPKISDFGIATRPESSVGLTRTGEVLGTPCYMAPEQIQNGGKVGPATDVHGLGAILYELLTGRPPFLGETPLETLELVRSADPLPPSRLRSNLPPDLETICLKCLHNHPQRRYAGVAALATDLRAFLRGEPILARRTGHLERGWRWCRRQPLVAALWATLLCVLVGGCCAGVYLWLRAERARRDAVASGEAARQLLAELIQTSPVIPLEPDYGQPSAKMEPLLQARIHCRSLLQNHPQDPELRIALSNIDGRVGTLYDRQEEWSKAQECFQEAIEIWSPLVRQEPENPEYRAWLAMTYSWQARSLLTREDYPAAVDVLLNVHALRQALVEEHPEDDVYLRDAAASQKLLLDLLGAFLSHDALEHSLAINRPILQQRLQSHPDDRVVRRRLGLLCLLEGELCQQRHANAEATTCWQEAYAHYHALVALRPDDLLIEWLLGRCCARLVDGKQTDPYYGEATSRLQWVLARIDTLIKQHPDEEWLRNLQTSSCNELAACHRRVGAAGDADRLGQQQVRWLLTRLGQPAGESVGLRRLSLLMQLTNALAQIGQQHAALVRAREAAALAARYAAFPELDRNACSWLGSFCVANSTRLSQLGDQTAALESAEQARRLLEEPGQNVPRAAVHASMLSAAWERIGKVRWKVGQKDESLAAFRQAARLQRHAFETDPSSAAQRRHLSRCYDRLVYWGELHGDWADVAAALHAREELWQDSATELMEVARDFHVLADCLARGKNALSASEKAQRRQYLADAERVALRARPARPRDKN